VGGRRPYGEEGRRELWYECYAAWHRSRLLTFLVLEGANPSAEGEDAEEGGDEGAAETVLDIADQFRLQKIEGVSKKAYQSDLKSETPQQHTRDSRLTPCRIHEGSRRKDEREWQV
jgi:hypothetical protein